MDLGDLEALAVEAIEAVNEDPERPPSAFRLARAHLGAGSVDRPRMMVGPPAVTFEVAGQQRIAIKASVPLEYAHFCCAHELGHVLLARAGFRGPLDEEEVCANYLGAALLMPRPAVRSFYRAEGLSPRRLAKVIVCTQTAAALRFGEVLMSPLAVVAPASVRVRGPEAWVWPDERTIRRWASGRPGPGVAKIRLTDQKRVALVGSDNDAA
jgi:hypothetical protein